MTGHDYDAITRADQVHIGTIKDGKMMNANQDMLVYLVKHMNLTQQLQIIRAIVSAKDFGVFTCDATNAIDFALDDMDAQAIELLREEDVQMYGASV